MLLDVPSRFPRSFVFADLLVVSTLLVAGCSSPPAETLSSTPVESSSNPTLTEDPNAYQPATIDGPAKNVPVPEMPELAKQETAEGREAFMYYFFELLNYTLEARDPKPLLKYYFKGAQFPDNLAAIADELKAEDSYVVNVKQTIKDIGFSPTPDPNGVYTGQISAAFSEYATYKNGELTMEPLPPSGNAQISFSMSWWEGQWFVEKMVVHPESL